MIKTWKKVYENDLLNIMNEFKDSLPAPAVLIIEGPLGAGKTSFVKAFVKEEGSGSDLKKTALVQSPSYSLVNEYGSILHADLYRLEKKEDVVLLELPMYLEEKDFILIEWGERFRREITREIGEDFKFYKLTIEINESNDPKKASRNYTLSKFD